MKVYFGLQISDFNVLAMLLRACPTHVYRCTMYLIIKTSAVFADGSKSLSWLKAPDNPGLSVWRGDRAQKCGQTVAFGFS
jgi:hypothetical protein